MSRDVPTLDELNGPGAEEASDFADYLEDLREKCLAYAKEHSRDYHTATEEIYDPVITKLHDENRRLDGKLVSAGEEIERLRSASISTDLLKRVADVMRRCDPEYCESHSVEQTTDEEWDELLEAVEDAEDA